MAGVPDALVAKNESQMIEEFIPIKDFPNYSISNYGTVFNVKKKRILKPSKTNCNYLDVNLSKNNKKYTRTIHRLVALAFIPMENGKPHVNHKDGVKTNNIVR